MSDRAQVAIAGLNIAGKLLANAVVAYQEHRAIAMKAGVSRADLDAADARFMRVHSDPLASEPKPEELSIYLVIKDAPVPEDDVLKASGFVVGDWVRQHTDGRWEVSEKGYMGHPGFGWLRDVR